MTAKHKILPSETNILTTVESLKSHQFIGNHSLKKVVIIILLAIESK